MKEIIIILGIIGLGYVIPPLIDGIKEFKK